MTEKKWWHSMVAYQVYPKSFYDSDGDGSGDVRGIIEKLDYIKKLGVNTIWVSPIYASPMKDNGYDISDYYAIDPQFGSMADVEELIAECGKKDMKVLMDLVVNHCSSEHEWFQKAMEDPKGPYGDYFIIREGKDGHEPTNWRSIFGGNVWEPIPGTNLYYFHTFLKEQPDLNWENKKLRREIYDMMNYWLEKGLGGFRVDAITYIKKDPAFPDLPADGADGLASINAGAENFPGIEVFLREMRDETFRKYDAFSVAEMAGITEDMLDTYIGADGAFSSIFDFSYMDLDIENGLWYLQKEVNASDIKQVLFPMQKMAQKTGGRLATVLENHDQPRSLSKYIPKEWVGYESAAMLATLNLTLRGVPFIYQGEEIGMINKEYQSIQEFDDVGTYGQYDRALLEGISKEDALAMSNRRSRDHSRTPMQWNNKKNAGFTSGMPWLALNDNYKDINVEEQERRKDSLLWYYRKLIELRTGGTYKDVFVEGSIDPVLEEYESIIAYTRSSEGKTILVVLNHSPEEVSIKLKSQTMQVLLGNYIAPALPDAGGQMVLKPYEAVIYKI